MTQLFSASLWNDDLNGTGAPQQPLNPVSDLQLDCNQRKLLSSVRVELSVEIGRVGLTLGELIDLAAGSRIELALPDALPVVLGIDGVEIARGRIVHDGEEALVEITDVIQPCPDGGNNSSRSVEHHT